MISRFTLSFRLLTGALLRAGFRDRASWMMGLLVPLMFMAFAVSVGRDGGDILTVRLVDHDQSAASLRLYEYLRAQPGIAVRALPGDQVPAAGWLREPGIVVIVRAGFGAAAVPEDAVEVVYRLEDADRAEAVAALVRFALAAPQGQTGQEPPISLVERAPKGAFSLRYIDYLLPGIVGLGVASGALSEALMVFVGMRQRRILIQLQPHPFGPLSWSARGSVPSR